MSCVWPARRTLVNGKLNQSAYLVNHEKRNKSRNKIVKCNCLVQVVVVVLVANFNSSLAKEKKTVCLLFWIAYVKNLIKVVSFEEFCCCRIGFVVCFDEAHFGSMDSLSLVQPKQLSCLTVIPSLLSSYFAATWLHDLWNCTMLRDNCKLATFTF